MRRFELTAKEEANKPLPELEGLSREAKITALAKYTRNGANRFKSVADEFKLSTPPPYKWKRHKKLALKVLEDLVADLNVWADAMSTQDKAAVRVLGDRVDVHLVENFRNLVVESEKVGVPSKALYQQLRELEHALAER